MKNILSLLTFYPSGVKSLKQEIKAFEASMNGEPNVQDNVDYNINVHSGFLNTYVETLARSLFRAKRL